MPSRQSANVQNSTKHTKQRRKNRRAAAAAEESSGSSSPIHSSRDSSDYDERKKVEKKSDTTLSNVAVSQLDSPSTASESEQPATKSKKRKWKAEIITGVTTKEAGVSSSEPSHISQQPPTTANATKQRDANADFESYYLKQVTAEFGNDIEKLRQAPDFKDSFVPVLIKALKQGADIFSDSEKRLVLGLDDRKK